MTGKKTANETAPTAVVANDADKLKRTLRKIGGSRFDEWNNILALQTAEAISKHSHPETQEKQISAGLVGIGPRDELEGMMAARLVAAHNAAMECYRRAMIDGQTLEGRRENLTRQVTPTKSSSVSSDSPSSPANPCTRKPVFGQRKIDGGIEPLSPLPSWYPLSLVNALEAVTTSGHAPMAAPAAQPLAGLLDLQGHASTSASRVNYQNGSSIFFGRASM
jgi:hypothetical protein